ncbi:SDR family NAD(P)-dependent oxidoreductase [Qipengyuania gelatinilytica]|uniref:SDR family NAD(P)-dependent oxidoreductase n=1 Tax=Qipengyuania gelatinilytica TaxID=2867231 RepID=A0ABX9A2C0_9SPHN|nr:SDR family NAD(P)-dependent oxidoreductase [Qipengyuania gelatinilytica]QZD95191.1 SDR family NAD(P)-dependent oxidoreductase [Qipengyuania gelatinilytica]
MRWRRAVVIGASGGIGAALANQLEAAGTDTITLSRSADGDAHLDLEDEASIAAAAERIGGGAPVDLVFVATGYLHGENSGPEKDWRQLDAEALARNFAINATGPALVAKHFLPLLPDEGRAGFAALAARVGSIGDNRLGGWYSYRASKAALVMLIRTLSVELARKKPDAFCAALHPGTVGTALSKPFQRNVPEGKLFTPEYSAERLLEVLGDLGPEQSGRQFAWDGEEILP